MISVEAYPNLLLDDKILVAIGELNEGDTITVLAGLKRLGIYGTFDAVDDIEPLKPKDKYSPIQEFKLKIENQEFRFLFVKIPKKHEDRKRATYAVLHAFVKKTKVIEKRDKDYALKLKKREGY